MKLASFCITVWTGIPDFDRQCVDIIINIVIVNFNIVIFNIDSIVIMIRINSDARSSTATANDLLHTNQTWQDDAPHLIAGESGDIVSSQWAP